MDNGFLILLGIITCVVVSVMALVSAFTKPSEEASLVKASGVVNPAMICPHCQTKGKVRTKRVWRKGGISGTKVMAALCTFMISLLFTGLAKKDQVTQSRCGECGNTWFF